MKLKKFEIVFLLLVGVLLIARATWGLITDVHSKLPDRAVISGRVSFAGIIQIEQATIKLKKYKTVFGIRLENIGQTFAVDRGADFCNHLRSQIKIGDTIKLIYRPKNAEYNTHVYQIEKGREIIVNYNSYKKKALEMIILAYAVGTAILVGISVWYLRNKRVHSAPPAHSE
ncbi:hypothetical protein JMG10_21440 [Nostoc ellipsosporum NOK]|nr:hypothetical protein [Nostoc ellipsosporum NOK]